MNPTSITNFVIAVFIRFVHKLLDVVVGNSFDIFEVILKVYGQELFHFTAAVNNIIS